MRKERITPTRVFRVSRLGFIRALILARSESDAIEVAIGVGIHRRGSRLNVRRVPAVGAAPLCQSRKRGLLIPPLPWNKRFVLILPSVAKEKE